MNNKTLKHFDFIIFQEADISTAKTPPGQKKALEILEAVALFFSKNGFEFKNLSQIARETGINRSTLLNYYHSLDDLKLSCIKYSRLSYQKYVTNDLNSITDPIQRLDSYFKKVFEWPILNPTLARLWVYFLYKTTTDQTYNNLNTDAVKVGRNRLSFLIQTVRKDLNEVSVQDLSLQIHTIITGHLWTEQTTHQKFSTADRNKIIKFCKSIISCN